uniref:C-type lectin domain-containing protein n=1 Tax=Poecilia formosa TaxID=48698 RepID=A0A087XIN1_POEFO
ASWLFYYHPYPAGVYVLSTNLFREYHYVSSPKTWAEAQRYCREAYADLATVDSPENDEIHPLIERNYWIGLYRDLWANWSDHSLLTFTNWETGQPDNKGSTNMTSCAAVDTSTGKWWDVDCNPSVTSFFICCTNLFREYHYMSTPKTWAEAQRYCREMYADLATADSPEENNRLLQKVQEPEKFAWIGLFYDMANWKWAMGDEDFNHEDFSNWKNEQGRSKYNLVETVMFWNDPKNYCRSHYTDLITVRSMSENDEIHPLIETNYWIGLHRALWANWSDLTPVHFTNWEMGQPDNNGVTNMTSCAAVNTSAGTWWGVDCSEKHEFICQTL